MPDPALTASPGGYRVRPLSGASDRDRLLARYVDAQVGVLPSLTKSGGCLFPGTGRGAPVGPPIHRIRAP